MSYLILPSRRLRQPQYAARVNFGHPHAVGLVSYVTMQNGVLRDLVSGNFATPYGSPSVLATPNGLAADVSATNTGHEFASKELVKSQASICAHTRYVSAGVTDGGIFLQTHSSNSATAPYAAASLKLYSPTAVFFQFNYNGAYASTGNASTGSRTAGDNEVIFGRFVSGSQEVRYAANNGSWVSGTSAYTGSIQTGSGPRIVVGEDYRLASRYSGRAVLVVAIWKIAISDALFLDYQANPFALLATDTRRIYFGAASGATDHALTASTLTGGTPTLGAPALGQDHALTASTLTSGAPTLGAPAVSQDHVLTVTALTGANPTLGAPVLSQTHVLTATALTFGAPTLGSPALSQDHALTASTLTGGTPTVGAPVLTEDAVGNDALTAATLTFGAPTLGTPALSQGHVLAATALTCANPTLGAPALTQDHVLTATTLTFGAPTLGAPVLTDIPPGSLIAVTLTFGNPIIGAPALTQDHVLTATALLGASPILDSPAFGQNHLLTATGITGALPTLGTPTLTEGTAPTFLRVDPRYLVRPKGRRFTART